MYIYLQVNHVNLVKATQSLLHELVSHISFREDNLKQKHPGNNNTDRCNVSEQFIVTCYTVKSVKTSQPEKFTEKI